MRIVKVLLAGSVLAGCASKPVYDPIIPFTASGPTDFSISSSALPETAVALDEPIIPAFIGEPVETSGTYYAPVYMPYSSAGSAGASSAGAVAAGGIIALLLIAAVETGIDAGRDGKINDFLKAQKFDGRKYFFDALSAELAKAGHTLKVEGAGGATAAANALKLDVKIPHYGYQIVGGPWAPTALAHVKLTSADGRQVLLDDSIAAGGPYSASGPWSSLGNETIILPYDPAHIMVDEDAITKGDPKVAVDGLKFTLESLARGVADLVRQEAPVAPVAPPPPEAAPIAAAADAATNGL